MLLPQMAHAAVPPTCPTGTNYNTLTRMCEDGRACPQNTNVLNGQCVIPATCPQGTTGPDANGVCTKTDKTNACPPNTTFEAGECKSTTSTPATCTTGTLNTQTGQCETKTTTAATCPSMDTVPDSQGRCTTTTATALTCPPGTTADPYSPQRCVSEQVPCPSGGYIAGIPGTDQVHCAYNSDGGHCFNGGTFDPSSYQCVFGPTQCPPGTTVSGTQWTFGECIVLITCQTGTLQISDSFPHTAQCETTTTVPAVCTQQGYTLQGAQCVKTDASNACPLNTTYQSGECIKTTATLATCPADTTGPDSQGECTTTTLSNACSQSSMLSDGTWYCIAAQINCPTGTSPDSTGICVGQPTCSVPPSGVVPPPNNGNDNDKEECLCCPETGQCTCFPHVGKKGAPVPVPPGTNEPTTIDGIDYVGHAIDEMQSDGITPTVVEHVLDTGQVTIQQNGNTAYYDPVNNITVITRPDGTVVTVSYGNMSGGGRLP
jgi:hypothetical protein